MFITLFAIYLVNNSFYLNNFQVCFRLLFLCMTSWNALAGFILLYENYATLAILIKVYAFI